MKSADSAIAERLIHRFRPRHAREPGALFVVTNPLFNPGFMIYSQPLAEQALVGEEFWFLFHFRIFYILSMFSSGRFFNLEGVKQVQLINMEVKTSDTTQTPCRLIGEFERKKTVIVASTVGPFIKDFRNECGGGVATLASFREVPMVSVAVQRRFERELFSG